MRWKNCSKGTLCFGIAIVLFFIIPICAVPVTDNTILNRPDASITSTPLTGYWNFNEGSGQIAADSTKFRNNATLSNGVQWTTGKFGSGVQFDGVNGFVRTINRSNLNPKNDFTVSLWINPTDWNSSEELFSNGLIRIYHRGEWAGDKVYFLIKINSTDSPGESAWDGWAGVCTSKPLPENQWSSVIAVKSGNKMTIYLNGMKSGEGNVLAGYTTSNSGLRNLFIGGNWDNKNFHGHIDEVRIWNRALSESQARNLYPYPPMIIPIGDKTVYEESSLRFTVVATDAMNRSLSYSVSGLPQGASFSPLSAREIFAPYSSGQKFSWTPASEQVGSHNICFSASNGTAKASECITITVKTNCLLDSSVCPADFTCRGDGECAEDVSREYGADARQTPDPLGGGVGYSNIVNPISANFTVTSRSELITALQNAMSGQIIYIEDNAAIDMTGDQNIVIPAGVSLASGRGRDNSLGALIYSDAIETKLFITAGEGVRITGLRLQGPDPERRTEQMLWLNSLDRFSEIPNSRGIQSSYSNLTVDNCDMGGWSHAAIYLGNGSHNNYIHNNFIHHNQRDGLGYGVVVDRGADAIISENVFDWNGHSIAGARGFPTASYEASYNLVLRNVKTHYFDMHGGNDISDPSVPAGGYVKIHHNTFMDSIYPAVTIRGIPVEGVWIYKNWALHNSNVMDDMEIFTQSLTNLPGHTAYEKMSVNDNWYGQSPPPVTV